MGLNFTFRIIKDWNRERLYFCELQNIQVQLSAIYI